MTKRSLPRTFALYAGLAAVLGVGLIVLLLLGPRWLTTPPEQTVPPPTALADARKIRARLFYVNDQGTGLISREQEVMYGEGPVEQAKRIVEAQIATPQAPLVSAMPTGTKLRTVFFTSGGELYADFSTELRQNHPGGTTNEILTVYTIVSVLMSNLPAISSVQIMIDGKEVDTLAGHFDLRRPMEMDNSWITE